MAQNNKTFPGIRPGKKLKMSYYSNSITVNGKQENKFTYNEYLKNDDGSIRGVKARYFVRFWGEYNFNEGDSVYVNKILDVNAVLYKNIPTIYLVIDIGNYQQERVNVGSQSEEDYYYEQSGNNFNEDDI